MVPIQEAIPKEGGHKKKVFWIYFEASTKMMVAMSSVILNCRVASASIQFYDIFFLVMVEPQRMVIKCCQEKVMSVDGQVSELRILLLQIPLLYLCKALCFKIRRWRTRCHDTRGGIPLVDSGLVFFFFLMLALLRRASFWPPSIVYISVINTQTYQITFIYAIKDSCTLLCSGSWF